MRFNAIFSVRYKTTLMSFRLRFVLDMQYNVHVRTNLTENKFQLNPKLTLGVYSGFTPVLLDLTQSKTINKPRVDTESRP